MLDIKVPTIGESISEATLAKWIKQDGDYVERDEVICELESEKATFELNAEAAGVLKIKVQEGETVNVGDVVAAIDTDAKASSAGEKSNAAPPPAAAGAPGPEAEEKPAAPQENAGKASAAAPAQPQPAAAQEPAAAAGGEVLEVKVPTVGESISEVTIAQWLVADGSYVERDAVICELESEKATFELNAEQAGSLQQQAKAGDTIKVGEVIARIHTAAAPPAGKTPSGETDGGQASAAPSGQTASSGQAQAPATAPVQAEKGKEPQRATPLAAAMMNERHLDPARVKGSGPQGKIFRQDVMAALEHPGTSPEKALFSRDEQRKKMSNLRKTISRRLVEAKNGTAMLTTFNEADMGRIMEMRKQFKEKFKEKHGVGLGFMSFFTKACCYALQEWPAVNSYIDGDELVYHEYCDISIAVSTPKGLVVPVIRNAESLGMADIEKKVAELAAKARDNKLTLEEMTGGTFTITNGGVFGSLMSTPIINIPQAAILGMHKIQDRPMAVNGQVVIRPMMYLALSYDHRVIDGRESVSFLVRVKELLENPEQLLFGQDPVKALLQV